MDKLSCSAELHSLANGTSPTSDEQSALPSSTRGRRAMKTPSGASRKDRRRMQNRIAQRAYRQRKESAIDLLSDKVLQLEKSREEMSREFIKFTTIILSQEAVKNCPAVSEYIRQSNFSLLRTAASINDEGQQDSDTQGGIPAGKTDLLPLVTSDTEQVSQPDLSTTSGRGEYHDSTIDGSDIVPAVWADWTPPSQGVDSYFSRPVNQRGSPLMNFQLPGASYASSLPCPGSYAAQERTFARRLHRATQEAGYLLASMKSPPPLLYQKVFGFCMHFETKEDIRYRMLDVLRRLENQTSNSWRYPFINHGGSETIGCSAEPVGPEIDRVRDLRLDHHLRILYPELEGDFFDPNEVEVCLRSCGVTIPPQKEFVTAHLDLMMFEDAENIGLMDRQYHSSEISMNSMHPEMISGAYSGHDFTALKPASTHHAQGTMDTATKRTAALLESFVNKSTGRHHSSGG